MTGLQVVREEEGGVAAGLGVRFGPGVGAGSGPDALLGWGEAVDLGLEEVPEAELVASGYSHNNTLSASDFLHKKFVWAFLGRGEGVV